MRLDELFLIPSAWPALMALPLLWAVLYGLDLGRGRRLLGLLGRRSSALAARLSDRQRKLRRRLCVGASLLAVIAILQPIWGEGSQPVEQRGVDIVIALDVSRSMLARDLPPDRLTIAKKLIRELAQLARGDRLALVVFAGEARLASPLTRDMDAFAELVEPIDPLMVSRGGTDIGAALETSLAALRDRDGEHEAVILLTDGEDHEGRGQVIARSSADRGVSIHCVGFGSERGSKLPVVGDTGESFQLDSAGREIVSAMDRDTLGRIASASNGVYLNASASASTLVDLYEQRIQPMARRSFEVEERRSRINRFQWPLLAALLLWLWELGLNDRRLRR